ncbi:hypothetical protein R1flu_012693 [Riccia fluitans]|uniref:Uncharacterized protein n=1 Tax=Riccia fluitans TaxID=41844 RepID=A0ABD1ZBN9_9MARC
MDLRRSRMACGRATEAAWYAKGVDAECEAEVLVLGIEGGVKGTELLLGGGRNSSKVRWREEEAKKGLYQKVKDSVSFFLRRMQEKRPTTEEIQTELVQSGELMSSPPMVQGRKVILDAPFHVQG